MSIDNPTVSLIMPTYNGSALVRPTIESVLAQTMGDFELLIVDDHSTDHTLDVLRSYADPRIRIESTPQNLGPVGARNQAVAGARGRYIAALDQDDLCLPERLARQVAHLDANPNTVMVATAALRLIEGRLHEDSTPKATSPGLLRWLIHVMNPVVWSTVMIRGETARTLTPFSRDEVRYAEDYDLYHRLAARGEIARLDDVLLHYRCHPGGASRVHAARMSASATKVLSEAYLPWFGNDATAAAGLMVRHVAAGAPVPDTATLDQLTAILARLRAAFGDDPAITTETSRIWWRLARAGLRSGQLPALPPRPALAAPGGLPATDLLVSQLIGKWRAASSRRISLAA